MLRSFLIYLSKALWAQNIFTGWKFAWHLASRFVAGEKIDDALRAVKELNDKGINATLDHLGESTASREDAIQAKDDILELLDQIKHDDVRANVSIKLTQIGLSLDEQLCENNLEQILQHAKANGNYIRIDIEDTAYTDKTYQLYRKMRKKGLDNAGVAVQSYLYRAEQDTRTLLEEGARFRLIKGAYKEPPELAFPKKADVNANFDLLAQIMMDASLACGSPTVSADGLIPPIPALGTHDTKRIEYAKTYCQKLGLSKQAIEFQMLYGIRRDLQDACVKEGYPVRIYVPYGTQWYPYYMRRLAERPANLWFLISNFFRR